MSEKILIIGKKLKKIAKEFVKKVGNKSNIIQPSKDMGYEFFKFTNEQNNLIKKI